MKITSGDLDPPKDQDRDLEQLCPVGSSYSKNVWIQRHSGQPSAKRHFWAIPKGVTLSGERCTKDLSIYKIHWSPLLAERIGLLPKKLPAEPESRKYVHTASVVKDTMINLLSSFY